MRKAHLVHGIFSTRGKGSIDKVEPWIEGSGYVTNQFDYGWGGPISALLRNTTRGRNLADQTCEGDIAVCHSNGATVAYMAATYFKAPFEGLVLINPALDAHLEFPPSISWIDVYYAPDDYAVLLAEIIPSVIWGGMGRRGYTGDDPRVTNINLHTVVGDPCRHSGAFKNITKFGPHLRQQLRMKDLPY